LERKRRRKNFVSGSPVVAILGVKTNAGRKDQKRGKKERFAKTEA